MSAAKKAAGSLPDPLAKREVLYSSKADRDELVALGESFLEEGFPLDALEFFVQARNEAHLERMLESALQDGDLFIYRHCLSALGRKADPERLRELAARAAERGKEQFAAAAGAKADTEPEED